MAFIDIIIEISIVCFIFVILKKLWIIGGPCIFTSPATQFDKNVFCKELHRNELLCKNCLFCFSQTGLCERGVKVLRASKLQIGVGIYDKIGY